MKTKFKILLTVLTAVFCCSMADAQIVYSNNFSLGGTGNISNTPPTVANTYAGGTNTAVWNDVLGPNDTGDLQANGLDTTTVGGDSWVLPFTPQTNHVYLLTVSVTFTNFPGNWIGVGFASTNPVNPISVGNGRFADSVGGYDWAIFAENTGNVQYFGGAKTANTIFSANNEFATGPGTETIQMLLDTQIGLWSAAGFVNGVQFGTNYIYATNTVYANSNTLIHAVGLTQSTLTIPTAVQWNSFTLATTLLPFIVNQPTSQTVSGETAYTNKVTVMADTNGGTLYYQWYAGGAPLVNGGSISGANTNVLVINPVLTPNQLTNYYVIVTNNFGSFTSALASVTVLTNPIITIPKTNYNVITLFSGGSGYVGSSPLFSVVAVGALPLTYQWLTNGVAIGGATNPSIAFTNLQAGAPTSYVCIVSNSYAEATNTWAATYVQTPTAAYPQSVLAAMPVDFWRLNEPDDGKSDGNAGVVCHDYQSGNNGIYTNTALGYTGYNSAEPTETSAFFGRFGAFYSYAGQMQNEDFAMTNGGNAEFAVEAWVNCLVGNGAPAVSQGVYGASDSFDLGMDTSASANFQFYVRNAGGTVFKADSAIPAADGNWHHLVGVCDEANSVVTLYVDGQVAASTAITTKSGLYEANAPIAIGAGNLAATGYNLEFSPFISDVATYGHALSISQVIGQYSSVPGYNPVPVAILSQPPTNGAFLANQTFTLPATIAGGAPFGYYWTNLTTASVLSSGQTSTSGSLAATLSIPNASPSLSGDQIQLVVTNGNSSTNSIVITLFNPPAGVTLSYTSPILYSNSFNGGSWSIGGMPLTAANSLVGGASTTWVDALGTNDTGAMTASGIPTTVLGDSWLVPFTPHSGYIYTITASLNFFGNPNNWVGPGFAQFAPTNNTNTVAARFTDTAVEGYDWMILTESSGNLQYFAGGATSGTSITNKTPFFTAGITNHMVQVILDTTAGKWKEYGFVDGIPAGTNTLTATNVPIGAVGLTENNLSSPNLVQWNYFAVTQVAPGGVPPYAIVPAPPTNVTLLADTSLSIAATNFGSAPFGYYWSNTNTGAILGSGSTGTMAPLSANLSVADVPAGWNGDTLALVMTNAYGTNISYVSVTVTNTTIIPTNKPTITGFAILGGTNVTISATNGQAGGTYYLLGSTNLATPLSQWLPVATNVISTNGSAVSGFNFSGTNVVSVGGLQQFYILSNTN